VITQHQYLSKYPIDPASERLILGTIHPHDHAAFTVQFFYGNMLSIWKILNQAYDNAMGPTITLDSIKAFLAKEKIAVSDTIVCCRRIHPTALDKDLEPVKLNKNLIAQIRTSKINHIFFTSGFGKNNAFKIFYEDLLERKITGQIKQLRETILSEEIFGRPVKLTVLYSPSGAANVGLVRSKLYQEQKHLYVNHPHPISAFKVDYYRQKFNG
jgi:G:T/U-mismatch repair DNA glycosylase